MLNFIEPTRSETLPPTPTYSDLAPKDYLLGIAKRIKDDNESTRSRINAQNIIQMCRRHRNMTASDSFGYWRNDIWCEHPSFQSLHNVPIFQQLVIGAESNFAQVDIRLDINAVKDDFVSRSIEKVARQIYAKLNDEQWNETNRATAFYASILMLNAFYISRFNKDAGISVPIPKFDDIAYEMGGMAICTQCYANVDYGSSMDGTCPECGSDNLSVMDEPETQQDQIVTEFGSTQAGASELIIAGGLDVSVDPNGAPADINSCNWIEWRQPAQKAELKRLYPHLELNNLPQWSYQTRLKKALMRYESGEAGIVTERDKTEYEVRQIWLDPTEYEEYTAPEDWTLGKTKPRILARGERLIDKYPNGLVMGVIGQEIAFVDGENFKRRIKSSLWTSDGVSFEGLGAKAGLNIQRKINQLENIAMEGETRSLKGSILYNPDAIDGSHLEGANSNIPLRPDFAATGDLKQYAMPLTVQGLSQETIVYMDRQKLTMQEIMGVPDVILGQDTATDKTYGGQALRTRNALGLLTPKTQSTARAKEGWLFDQLDIIQTHYSPAALDEFGEFLEEEKEAFLSADLEKLLTISYIPGTEIPESRFEKQLRMRQDIAAGFLPLTPELQAQMAEESNYDAPDINNYDSNIRLAEKRFKFIADEIKNSPFGDLNAFYMQIEMQMIDPATGQRAADMTGNPVPNPIIQQLMAMPELVIFNDAEDHQIMAGYWAAKVREIAAGGNQDIVLLAACDQMVQRHNEATFRKMAVEAGQMGTAEAIAGAPAAIGQKMLESGGEEEPGTPGEMKMDVAA